MEHSRSKTLSFIQAKQFCAAHSRRLQSKIVGIKEALGRITYASIFAATPQPSFDESLRDGYVISAHTEPLPQTQRFSIDDEIPAGIPYAGILSPGAACKIMTGGCVPEGGERVVPKELCKEIDGEVFIEAHVLESRDTYIKRKGIEIAEGDVLLPGGMVLQPEHVELLTACGIEKVEVSAQPKVGYFCTGSELVASVDEQGPGQKNSSNSLLLDGLLMRTGALPRNLGIVQDKSGNILELLAKAKTSDLDMVISTGGMGPGKYDLVEQAFVDSGGTVIFHSLNMRPGKSLLFGMIGRTLYFGLPGPPPAVRTLFHALVGPALMMMQGARNEYPRKMKAFLQHDVSVKRHEIMHLKDGVLTFDEGVCLVRFTEKHEVPTCFIILEAGRKNYAAGELVEVLLAARRE